MFEKLILIFIGSAAIGIGVSYSYVYLFHVVLGILLYVAGLKVFSPEFSSYRLPSRLHYIVFAMIVWYTVSLVWSVHPTYTLEYLFYICCGSSIVLTMVWYSSTLERLEKVFKTLAFVFIIEIIISLLECVGIMRWPISPFSPLAHLFQREYSIVRLSLTVDQFQHLISTPSGFRWNPNNLAVNITIITPFFLCYEHILVRYAGMFAAFIIIFMSHSRGNLLALMVILFMYFLLYYKSKILMASLLIVVLIFLSPFSLLDVARESSDERINGIGYLLDNVERYLSLSSDGSQDSIGLRKKLIELGFSSFEETYGLGFGGGGSMAVIENAGGVGMHHVTSMHNFWLELLFDSGVLFTGLFVAWYIYIICALYKISYRNPPPLIKYYAASTSLSLVGFAIGVISASSALYFLPMWIMFGFAIGTINNFKMSRYENSSFQ